MEDFLITQIDINIFLQNLSSSLVQIMKWVSFIGQEYFYMVFMPLLYWCIDRRAGFRIGAMLMISNGIVNGFKMAIQSPRPYWLDNRVIPYAQENTFGIPSGHSANAASVWGVLADHFKKRWLTFFLIIVTFLIGASRMVLGVHFLIDVISGWLLGVLLLVLFLRVEKPIIQWFNPLVLRHKIFIAVFSSILLLLPVLAFSWMMGNKILPDLWFENAGHPLHPYSPENTFTIAGIWAGLVIGYSWFRHKFGDFSTQGKFHERLLRFLLGFIGLIAIWFGLDQIFPESANTIGLLFRYLRYGLVGFWMTGLAPFVFIKLKISQQIKV